MAWFCRACLCLLILATGGSARSVQDASTDALQQPSDPVGITKEQAQSRIAELESATDLEEGQKTRLLEAYRQIVQRLDAARASADRAEAFQQSIQAAPADTLRLQEELTRASQASADAPAELLPTGATSDSLQQQLTEEQAEQSRLDSRHTEFEQRLAEEQDRPDLARTQSAEARTALEDLAGQLEDGAPPTDAPEVDRVNHWLRQASHLARTQELRMLEQELLSNRVRVERLTANRDLVAWQLAQVQARVGRLETWVSEVRQAEAEQARQEAERLRRAAIGKHPLIQDLAAEIAEITREAEPIGPQIDQTRARRQSIEDLLTQIEDDLTETRRSLKLGITRSLGTVLLEQRRALPNPGSINRSAADRSRQAADARLRVFRIGRERQALTNPHLLLDRLVSPEAWPDLSDRDRADLRAQVEALLQTKKENLDRLEKAYQDQLTAYGKLEAQERDLVAKVEELAGILDQNLLWIPNASPLGTDTIRNLDADLVWLLSPSSWHRTEQTLLADLQRRLPLYSVCGLILCALVVLGRRLIRQLDTIAARVGKIREDHIGLTFAAMLLEVLHVLPVPALGLFLGWRLQVAADADLFAKSVGYGLVAAGITMAVIQMLRATFRSGGLVTAHFGWSERSGVLLRRHLLWFLGFALPGVFVIAATQYQSDPLLRHGLGRLSFLTLMVATGALAFWLLRPGRGLRLRRSAVGPWAKRTRALLLPASLLVLTFLLVLAGMGYYYAALQLEYRFNQTLLIILAASFLHGFLRRWLLLSQRRLSLKVAMEKRAALIKSREAAEGDGAGTEDLVDVYEEIDVAGISHQTQDILRVCVGLVVAVALWFAWAGVLPALGVLDDVDLWHHAAVVDGKETQVPVTLANLGMALLFLAVTVTAARNMPGFLEMTLLQRLPLDAGARYATRTLLLYTIVAVGLVLMFHALGVGWTSVQWLVAALTVGLGFGLQEIFANFMSGLILLLERPIRVGDTVTVGETSGVVTRIRMRATTITDWSRKELVVPNKRFITDQLINWTLSDPVLRLDFLVGIAYGSDTTLAHQTMQKVCADHPMVLDQPEPTVFFVGFGSNSLDFEVRAWVSETTNTGRSRILHDLHMAIDQACREQDITIAFPQRDLHLKTADAVLRVEQVVPSRQANPPAVVEPS